MRIVAALIIVFSIISASCKKSDLHQLHVSLNKAAAALNAAARTNRSFYESGIYGPQGSAAAIDVRQQAATAIHNSNEALIIALDLAKGLTPATFEQGKLSVLAQLAQAASVLHVGNQNIDLVLQAVVVLINQAVILLQAFSASQLPYVLPEIRQWSLPRLAQV